MNTNRRTKSTFLMNLLQSGSLVSVVASRTAASFYTVRAGEGRSQKNRSLRSATTTNKERCRLPDTDPRDRHKSGKARRYVGGVMARTRRGLPEPPTILRGAAMTTAPLGGN